MVTRRPADPFELVIALRDRLARRPRTGHAAPDDALGAIERALSEAKQPSYDAARRGFHARSRRTPGQAVAAELLPPVSGTVAPGTSALGATLPLVREGDRLCGPLVLESRLGREVRLAVRVRGGGPPGARARLSPDEPLAAQEQRRALLELEASSAQVAAGLAVELCDCETVLAHLLVSETSGARAETKIVLCERDAALLGALRGLQQLLLDHPRTARRLVGALVAEGRRFAATSEGRHWLERLDASPWLHEARLVFQMTSLSLLENLEEPEALPSAYLDAFFMAAAAGDSDALLDRLFGGEEEDGSARA